MPSTECECCSPEPRVRGLADYVRKRIRIWRRRSRILEPGDRPDLDAKLACESGLVALYFGDSSRARVDLERAIAEARAAGDLALEAQARTSLGWVLGETYGDEAAFEHHQRAVHLFRQLGDQLGEAEARLTWVVGREHHERTTPRDLAQVESLLATVRRTGNRALETRALSVQALLLLEAKHFPEAISVASAAEDLARRVGLGRFLGAACLTVAVAHDMRGSSDEAWTAFEESRLEYDRAGERAMGAIARIYAAGLGARLGLIEESSHLLGEAKELLADTDDARYRALATLQRGQIEVALARRAIACRDREQAALLLATAAHRMEEVTRPRASNLPALDRVSFEARHLLHKLQEELARNDLAPVTLRVATDYGSFALGAEVRHLPDAPTLRQLLRALVERHQRDPGGPLSANEVLSIGWPGEAVMPHAARLRVRDAIRRLRRSGTRRGDRDRPSGRIPDRSSGDRRPSVG